MSTSGGAFRDASAAIERAVMLESENEALRAELAELAEMRVKVEEIERLRAEVDTLRARARGDNEGAFVKRLGEERDELAREVRELRDRLATQEGELVRLRRVEKHQRANVAESLLEAIAEVFKSKR